MLYPRPDPPLTRRWQAATEVLRENTCSQRALMRAAYPTTLEVIATSADDDTAPGIGTRNHRDGSHYCDEVLRRRAPLCVQDASQDAQWDGSEERRAGLLGYCGSPLLWPDDEAFGTLAFLNQSPLSEDQLSRGQRLLETLAAGINAQLALLYRSQQQHYESTHDALTGLANRLLFLELAEHQLQRHKRSGEQLWLLLWSIDDYGALRKDLGSDEADILLRATVERAQGCIRQSDVFARLDDNCFALLISEANEFVATAVADRVRRNVRRIQLDTRVTADLTLSCGMSPHVGDEALDSWIKRAEAAMQAAHIAGGNQGIALG
jgi:diguanylate cyclase (GGDEF)-like protein